MKKDSILIKDFMFIANGEIFSASKQMEHQLLSCTLPYGWYINKYKGSDKSNAGYDWGMDDNEFIAAMNDVGAPEDVIVQLLRTSYLPHIKALEVL